MRKINSNGYAGKVILIGLSLIVLGLVLRVMCSTSNLHMLVPESEPLTIFCDPLVIVVAADQAEAPIFRHCTVSVIELLPLTDEYVALAVML